jgi:hypothetical protein
MYIPRPCHCGGSRRGGWEAWPEGVLEGMPCSMVLPVVLPMGSAYSVLRTIHRALSRVVARRRGRLWPQGITPAAAGSSTGCGMADRRRSCVAWGLPLRPGGCGPPHLTSATMDPTLSLLSHFPRSGCLQPDQTPQRRPAESICRGARGPVRLPVSKRRVIPVGRAAWTSGRGRDCWSGSSAGVEPGEARAHRPPAVRSGCAWPAGGRRSRTDAPRPRG